MTSIEIPYSIAAALPSLAVLDITNDVSRAVAAGDVEQGVAFISPRGERALIRINEREAGIFEDFEALLARIVPLEQGERETMLTFLLGPRSEQIPVADRCLRLGEWQRVLLIDFDRDRDRDRDPSWQLALVGERDS